MKKHPISMIGMFLIVQSGLLASLVDQTKTLQDTTEGQQTKAIEQQAGVDTRINVQPTDTLIVLPLQTEHPISIPNNTLPQKIKEDKDKKDEDIAFLIPSIKTIDLEKNKSVQLFIKNLKKEVLETKKDERTLVEKILYGRKQFYLIHLFVHATDVMESACVAVSLLTKDLSYFYGPTDHAMSSKLLKLSTMSDGLSILVNATHKGALHSQRKMIRKMMSMGLVEEPESLMSQEMPVLVNEKKILKTNQVVEGINKSTRLTSHANTAGNMEEFQNLIKDGSVRNLDRCGMQFWEVVDLTCTVGQYLCWTGSYVLKNVTHMIEDEKTRTRCIQYSMLCDTVNLTLMFLMKTARTLINVRRTEMLIADGKSKQFAQAKYEEAQKNMDDLE